MILRLAERDVEMRAFSLTDMMPYGWNARVDSSGATKVSDETSYGLPAFARAVRYYAEALASMPLHAWQGEGIDRRRSDLSAQGRLFGQTPNDQQDTFMFWEIIGMSLIVPRNAYIWKMLDSRGRVLEWWALDPVQVEPRYVGGEMHYRVQTGGAFPDPVGRGPRRYELTSKDILHIRGSGLGGMISPSLIEQHRDALGADIAAMLHQTQMFGKGAILDYAVMFPQGVNRNQVKQWRDMFRQTHQGPQGERTVVLGSGADIKPIGMSAKDAELVALSHMSIEKAALIVGVPISLLGPTGTAVDRAPLEQTLTEWYTFGIGPLLRRIEQALKADRQVFPNQNTNVYPGFKADDFIRADIATQDAILHANVQDGRMTVDEARAETGRPPLPDGLGAIPQVVPVGGAPNPETPPPTTPEPTKAVPA